MKTTQEYTCETCGYTSEDEAKVKKCESSHPLVSKVEGTYAAARVFPKSLKVTFDDGRVRTYIISDTGDANFPLTI